MEKGSKNMKRYLKASILPTFNCISMLDYVGSPVQVKDTGVRGLCSPDEKSSRAGY